MSSDHQSIETTREFDTRLARLEEGYISLRGEVHNLAESVKAQGEHLSESMAAITDRLGSFGRTNWGVYFSGLGVLLAFVVTIGGGALAPLYILSTQNSRSISVLDRSLTERIDSKVFASDQLREREMQSMDEVLQREMRLLNEAQDTDTTHIQRQISKIDSDLYSLKDKFHSHELLEGHPTAMQKHVEATRRMDDTNSAMSDRIAELDAKLQNEMILSQASVKERLDALDSKIQAEISGLIRVIDDRRPNN